MKILLATNYLKGSLSAVEAANIIEKAALSVDKEIIIKKIPIADGGDGTLDAIKLYTDFEEKISFVSDPLGRNISAKWLIINHNEEKTAVIEAAQACGLSLLKQQEYNPLKTTTFGVGELINQAAESDCKKIIITIGGSSTNDGGAGILQALGIKLLDKKNNPISQGAEGLINLKSIDISGLNPKLKDIKILVACDVKNPLCGKNGASFIYAPQKGANNQHVKLLDDILSVFADITSKTIGHDYRNFPGAGAAGGISFAMKSFLNAELTDGFKFIATLSDLEEKIKASDVVITTEGRLDSQTLQGKAPFQVAMLAKKNNIPAIIITGSAQNDLNLENSGITAVFQMTGKSISQEESIKNASYFLEKTAIQVIKHIKSKDIK
ncbi:MAG: glycerate kinase [bacterium]